MKEVKLKNGKKVKLKELSLDDRDFLLDNTQYVMDNGEIQEVKMMHSTLTKYLRTGIDGDTSDKTLMKMSFEDRVENNRQIELETNARPDAPPFTFFSPMCKV